MIMILKNVNILKKLQPKSLEKDEKMRRFKSKDIKDNFLDLF